MTLPIQWLPWMEEALRLTWQGRSKSTVARLVQKDESALTVVMGTPEWRSRYGEMRRRMDALWEARMIDLWELSPKAIATMREIVKEYDELKKAEPDVVDRQAMKGYRAARQDAKEAAGKLLDMVGLRAPEKVEVTSESHHTETRETKLTYEQRLTLIREQRAANLPVDEDLLDLPIQDANG